MITPVVSEVVVCNRARYGALGPVVGNFTDYLGRHGYAGITKLKRVEFSSKSSRPNLPHEYQVCSRIPCKTGPDLS